MREVMGMYADPRVTPTGDTAPDNPALGRLTVERLGLELAAELGVDPSGLTPAGLSHEAVRRYEAETHSPNQQGNG
ncbi:hypothetical protein J2Z79_000412 [Symbiobacterium terraclitae]|uniref:Uncharacterized protein n=1 Tax=Symbiobacterium terraclitae TaxID=557451 RepID=A0ABS4JND3_9FIRM|nr:hypothetical protein [Symbiobacterium terraclitae]MBP2017038.1 hypothetical protein [Symbiobacterium terraclitae]